MKLSELIEKGNLTILTSPEYDDTDITGCYIGDLLSWVMAQAKQGNVWITVQTNINVVAVASLNELACVVIPEGIEVEEATLKKASLQDVTILSSKQTAYELAVLIHTLSSNVAD